MGRNLEGRLTNSGCKGTTRDSPSLSPANIDEERHALAMCILDAGAAREAMHLLEIEDFSLDSHRRIFEAIRALINKGPLDTTCIIDWLARRRQLELVGGAAYISDLATEVKLPRTMPQRVSNLRDYTIRRLLLRHSEKLAEFALRLDMPAREVLNSARHSLDEVEKLDG